MRTHQPSTSSVSQAGQALPCITGPESPTNHERSRLAAKNWQDRYGVPVKTPAEWACKGTGPRYAKFGRHVRYRLNDVINWEREQFPREKRSTA
jgi:hypothetical protein